MNSLRTSWRLSLVTLHLISGGLLTLGIRFFQRNDQPHPAPGIVTWWHRRLCRLLHLNIQTRGALSATPVFVISNHISWTDISVLGALGQLCFVSKQEVRHWPLIGWLAAQAGTLFIQRGGGQTERLQQEMTRHLGQGCHVTLFPEGTTTDGREVRNFFPRLFALAQQTGHPLQPIALRYSQHGDLSPAAPFIGEDALVPHLWRLLQQESIDVDIHILDPLQLAHQDRKSIARLTRQSIIDVLYADEVKTDDYLMATSNKVMSSVGRNDP